MANKKFLPYAVEQSIKELGSNIRTARLRRNISLVELSERLGVHRTVLSDAEHGKPGTSISVYVGMLWVMDLLTEFTNVAAPDQDSHGLALARFDERERASSPRKGLNNDF